MVPLYKNIWERLAAKNYCPVSVFSVVSKAFERLVNNWLVNHLGKCGLFSDFQYGFRSSRLTADLSIVVSERTASAFNRPVALELLHLYPRLSIVDDMMILFTNLRFMEFCGRYLVLFHLFSVIDCFTGSGWDVFTKIFH